MTEAPFAQADDGTLVELARDHKEKAETAFRALYERYKDEVFAFLARLLQDDVLAEDVLQESFFRVYKNLERFEKGRSFRAWLYQIARNAALDAIRVRRKEDRLATEAGKRAAATDADASAEAEAGDERLRAREALASLPEETRALLIQRHGLGMKLEALAESFSCNERTIRSRLVAAAALLQRALAPGGRP
ncbi:MAG TPA: RNA polymerase sigma factor [Planctomycetota bacterium]|nr:RNA polymerase sigma factor [Planctomycetota bacterium]